MSKPKKLSARLILGAYQKTNGRCWFCGIELVSGVWPLDAKVIDINRFVVDHAIPRCLGGGNGIENLLPSCFGCNSSYWASRGIVLPRSAPAKFYGERQ